MANSERLQDRLLEEFQQSRTPVLVLLANGAKIRGLVEGIDAYAIWVRTSALELVYKHAIVSITPVQPEEQAADASSKGRAAAPARQAAAAEQSSPANPRAQKTPGRGPKISFRHSRLRNPM